MCSSRMHAHSQQGDEDSQNVVSEQTWTQHPDVATAIVVHTESAIRNKKLLLAYM
jgi:hypothetical protein